MPTRKHAQQTHMQDSLDADERKSSTCKPPSKQAYRPSVAFCLNVKSK